MSEKIDGRTVGELTAELQRLKEHLSDLEDVHAFTFGKTTVHIGAEQAGNMQQEYEEECRAYREQIARLEGMLKARDVR
jgi:hypothetical protein